MCFASKGGTLILFETTAFGSGELLEGLLDPLLKSKGCSPAPLFLSTVSTAAGAAEAVWKWRATFTYLQPITVFKTLEFQKLAEYYWPILEQTRRGVEGHRRRSRRDSVGSAARQRRHDQPYVHWCHVGRQTGQLAGQSGRRRQWRTRPTVGFVSTTATTIWRIRVRWAGTLKQPKMYLLVKTIYIKQIYNRELIHFLFDYFRKKIIGYTFVCNACWLIASLSDFWVYCDI